MKTWGDVFRQRLTRGEDHGSAALAADNYASVLERDHNPTAQDEMIRMLDECARLGKENAALRKLAIAIESDKTEPEFRRTWARELLTPNDRVEGRDAASSRRVPSHDGLCPGASSEK